MPLHHAIVGALREMIQNSELPPGSKINESALCAEFGISRTPLREALKLLAAEGLVVLRPRRSAIVAPIARSEIAAIFEVMGALERLASRLVCERMSDAELADVEQMHGRLRELHRKGSRRAYFKLNRQIHNRIIALAANPALEASYAGFSAKLARARALANFDASRWQASVDEHEAIIDALRHRAPARLGDCLEEHNRRTGEAVVAALDKLAPGTGDLPDVAGLAS